MIQSLNPGLFIDVNSDSVFQPFPFYKYKSFGLEGEAEMTCILNMGKMGTDNFYLTQKIKTHTCNYSLWLR